MPQLRPWKAKKINNNSNNREFSLWHCGIGRVSAPPGCRFDSWPSTVGYRIHYCCSYNIGHNWSLDLIPGLGTSICHGAAKKKATTETNLNSENNAHMRPQVLVANIGFLAWLSEDQAPFCCQNDSAIFSNWLLNKTDNRRCCRRRGCQRKRSENMIGEKGAKHSVTSFTSHHFPELWIHYVFPTSLLWNESVRWQESKLLSLPKNCMHKYF